MKMSIIMRNEQKGLYIYYGVLEGFSRLFKELFELVVRTQMMPLAQLTEIHDLWTFVGNRFDHRNNDSRKGFMKACMCFFYWSYTGEIKVELDGVVSKDYLVRLAVALGAPLFYARLKQKLD
jgi:hypothetical protein